MKILACLTVGDGHIIREWDFDGHNVIVARLEEHLVAVPLDESKVHLPMTREDFEQKLLHTFSGPGRSAPPERLEAFVEYLPTQVYLGSLNIADSTILPLDISN